MPYEPQHWPQMADTLAQMQRKLAEIQATIEARLPAPVVVQDRVRSELLAAIAAAFADGNWTAAEVLARAGQDDAPADQLAYALAPVLGKGRDPARVLGKYLGRIKDTAADGWTLIQIDTRAGNGSALWSVRRVRGV